MESPTNGMETQRETDPYGEAYPPRNSGLSETRRETGPKPVTPRPSDLADDLKVPYPFDTQAQDDQGEELNQENRPPSYPSPPSPPNQDLPQPSSSVYAVANPEILRAQGISPQDQGDFTPRTYRKSDHASNQYDNYSTRNDEAEEVGSRHSRKSGTNQEVRSQYTHTNKSGYSQQEQQGQNGYWEERSREPTPYPREDETPQQEGPEDEDQQSLADSQTDVNQNLPPQHPPLSTQHTSRSELDKSQHSAGIKRVYVESPSFTKEEEDEYRFVNSRLEDIEDKQETFRAVQASKKMDEAYENRGRGYGGDDQRSLHDSMTSLRGQQVGSQGGYSSQGRGRDDRDRRSDDRSRASHGQRNIDPERYEDRNREMADRHHGRDNRNREMNDYPTQDRRRQPEENRYEDRNAQMEGYGDHVRYERDNYENDLYDKLQDDRYAPPQRRERGYDEMEDNRDQNGEGDDDDLRREEAYQRDLKQRIEMQKRHDAEITVPGVHRDSYDNFARDSLEYPGDTTQRDNFARDSLDYGDYHQQNRNDRDWGVPPKNPFAMQQAKQEDYDENNPPPYYDPDDAAKMEVVHPHKPRYDFVENNKVDYGFVPRKTYRDLKAQQKEDEAKLQTFFIKPTVPGKPTRRGPMKKSRSAQPEHFGHQPPVEYNQYQENFKPSSAEELWAKKSAALSRKKDIKIKSGPDANKGKLRKYPSDSGLVDYQRPPRSYGTPTQGMQLQPIENKPIQPKNTEFLPAAIEPQSPLRRHHELKPISQEIVTEDGQKISVDINLRLISPPPGQPSSQRQSPQQHQQHPHHQLAILSADQAQQQQDEAMDHRPLGVQYQMDDYYGDGKGDSSRGYKEDPPHHPPPGEPDVRMNYDTAEPMYDDRFYSGARSIDQIEAEYNRLYGKNPPLNFKERDTGGSPEHFEEDGYAARYIREKNKDKHARPNYKIYGIQDYRKMMKEVAVGTGTLGPNFDTEEFKDKIEKRHRQFEYARIVMEKNRMHLQDRKQPAYPRKQKETEEQISRKKAIDYSKTVPKPTVKPKLNQFNSYEVAAQLSPTGKRTTPGAASKAPSHKTLDVIDMKALQQRHEQERQNVAKIRSNMESVLTQTKA